MPMARERILAPIRSSLAIKTFAICFVAVHMPLIALILYLLLSDDPAVGPIIIICLGATLVGTIVAIRSMSVLLRPLDRIAGAIVAYGNGQGFSRLGLKREDEVGRIASGVETLIIRLEATLDGLRRQAMTDPLTALGNRRWLIEEAGATFARAMRDNTTVSACIFDLDHVKRINDTHGHAAGDLVLMAVAEIARQKVRPYDLIARWGGEEFCVVVSGLGPTGMAELAERLRAAIATASIGTLPSGTVTASFGVATDRATATDFATLLRAADKALYAAKAAGRNRIVALDSRTAEPREPDSDT